MMELDRTPDADGSILVMSQISRMQDSLREISISLAERLRAAMPNLDEGSERWAVQTHIRALERTVLETL
jgi:hypothetical protein